MICLNAIKMETYKPYLAMLLVQLVYAGMALLSKATIAKGMNPHVFVVYRQGIAALVLAPFAYFCERKNATHLSYNLIGKIFMVSLCGVTLSLNLYYYALNYTTATLAAASTNTIPAITFIMAIVLRMERLRMRKIHGVAKVMGSIVGVLGALVYAFVKGPSIHFNNWHPSFQTEIQSQIMNDDHGHKWEWIKGSLLMLLANIAYSFWLIFQGMLVKEYPAKLRLITLQCFFSSIQSAFWALAMERKASAWKLGWDVDLLSVAYCGILVTAMSYWLQFWAMEKKGPVFASVFTPVALIVTAIFSAFLWKETFYVGSVIGAMLLVIGLYGVLWGKIKEWSIIANDKKHEVKTQTLEEIITEK